MIRSMTRKKELMALSPLVEHLATLANPAMHLPGTRRSSLTLARTISRFPSGRSSRSTIFKVDEVQNSKAVVSRITGSFNASGKHGRIPLEGLQHVVADMMPPHVILSEKFQDAEVEIDFGTEDELIKLEHRYFDAGPKSTTVRSGMKSKVKGVESEFVDATLIGEDRQTAGYGKLRTAILRLRAFVDTFIHLVSSYLLYGVVFTLLFYFFGIHLVILIYLYLLDIALISIAQTSVAFGVLAGLV